MVRARRAPGLGTKLQLVMGLIAASVLLVAVLGYLRLVGSEQRLVDVYERRVVPLRALQSISDRHAIDIVDAVHKVCAGSMTPEAGEVALRRALAAIDAAWHEVGARDPELVRTTVPLLDDARVVAGRALELMHEGKLVELEELRRHELYPKMDPLTVRLGQLTELEVRGTDTLVQLTRDELRRARRTATLALLATAALALLVAVAFSRRLTRSLRAIGVVVHAAARGDLSQRVALAGHDELADMARDVDDMVCGLEASAQAARVAASAKAAFLNSMSHDLRTPLNAILGNAQLLVREEGRSDERRVETGRIIVAGQELLRLVDELLAIARSDAGSLDERRAALSARVPAGAAAAVAPAAADVARLATWVAVLPPPQRQRLLERLVLGEMDDALALATEVAEAEARAGLRGLIESFQVERLIDALRAGPPAL
jgi:signal transduction histidine kinase